MRLVIDIDREFLKTIKENEYDVYAGRVYDMIRSGESLDDVIQEFFCEVSSMEYDNTTRMKAYYFDKILKLLNKYHLKDPEDVEIECEGDAGE